MSNYRNLQHDTAFAHTRYALDCNLAGIASQSDSDCSAGTMKLILAAIAMAGQPHGAGNQEGGWTHGSKSAPEYLGISETTYYANLKPLIAAGLVVKFSKGRSNSPQLWVDPVKVEALGELSTKARKASIDLDDVQVGSIDPFVIPTDPPVDTPVSGVNGATHGAINGATEGAQQGATEGANQGTNQGTIEGAPEGTTDGATQGSISGSKTGATCPCSERHWLLEPDQACECLSCSCDYYMTTRR